MQRFEAKILKTAQAYLEEKYGYSFYYDLVGSAGRGLVTRIKNGNKGYDFDYNLILDPPSPVQSYVDLLNGGIITRGIQYSCPSLIKEQFREAFNYAVEGTEYDFPEDSSAVLTIKCKDRKNSRILHSCDLAIVYYDNAGTMYCLEHYKSHDLVNSDGYGFQCRKFTYNFNDKLDEILEFLDGGWDLISSEYIKLKNRGAGKKSFVLYVEAVNNIYDQYEQDIYDEKYRQGYFDEED